MRCGRAVEAVNVDQHARSSESGRQTIRARIGGRFEHTIRMRGDQTCMSDGFVEILQRLDRMPARTQFRDQRGVETLLELERVRCITPGAAEQPARCSDGLLRILAKHGIAREYRGLRLRLTIAAHRAVYQLPTVLESC